MRFSERLGRLEGLPPAPRCWVHAVSVGEALASVPLVQEIRNLWPDLNVVVSTVTPTGAIAVRERLGSLATHCYFPLDFPGPVRRAVRTISPVFFVAMETEIWPNFFRELDRGGVPVIVANGRISDRSFRRYRLVRPFLRKVLRPVRMFAMQSTEDARRIRILGALPERVVVTGNLKTELSASEAGVEARWNQLLELTADEPIWIAGSTHAGEEEIILDAFVRLKVHHPGLILVVAPRHIERVAEVERLIQVRGLRSAKRSALPAGRRVDVIVLDTIGELAQLYEVARIAFVGGSLIPWGGQNMLEPALRRKPVLFGPHTSNFRESATLLLDSGGGFLVKDSAGLETEAHRLLADPDLARRMGEAAFAAVASRQGAVRETMELLKKIVSPRL
ncbi:MAG: 3-deoxy-D-manno-octulosonic acid transferase [Candidatus Methylomirabilia bacterium]